MKSTRWLAILLTLFVGDARGQQGPLTPAGRAPWEADILELFATLPVQDGGRIKPMDSLAGLRLLQLNGKRTLKLRDGTKLNHRAWLLDCFLFPDLARTYPCFRIENDAVLAAVGLESRSKRDWYTFDELALARQKIASEAISARSMESAERSVVQGQLLKLESDLRLFEGLILAFDFTRRSLPTAGLEEIWDQSEADLATVLEGASAFKALWRGTPEDAGPTSEQQALMRTLAEHLAEISERGRGGPVLLAPHPDSAVPERWWRVTDLVDVAFDSELDLSAEIAVLRCMQRLEGAKNDRAALRTELQALHGLLVGRADARGEYRAIELEVNLYRWDPFTRSLVIYLLGFLAVCFSWLAPRQGWLRKFTWGATLGATAVLIFGIVLRCIIRQRPPVVSLYDTVLFITAGAVIMALVTEWLTRQRVALGLSTFLGTAGMFLAGRYELKEVASAGDTMASVVAVLDTNYYLAIHVTTITLGYAAGLLAGGLGHVWILGRLVGYRLGDRDFYGGLTRMIYGVVCFGLLLSVFGTIMGGVWANDSWGRFWGWDPKENGALLICLWEIMILHARMGGYIRDRGLAVMAVLGGVVVSASWWGVNLLGVGLHSYGFTSGAAFALASFWALEGLVVVAAAVGAKRESLRGKGQHHE